MQELLTGVWYSFMPGIAIGAMLYPDFVVIPEWITQRNTRNRIKKLSVLDHLRKLFPTHHIVVIGKLTKDDKWEDGREFKAGSEWVLDANTRRLLWEEGKTDKKPDKVLAIRLENDTLIGLRNLYWSYDNPSATELAAEIVTGIFKSIRYVPQTKKFIDGAIVTALSYMVKFHDPTTYGKSGLWTNPDDPETMIDEYKRSQTLLAVRTYLDTIKAVDELLAETGFDKYFDQTFICSLMLHHKKYGIFNDSIVTLCKTISENLLDEEGDPIVPATPNKGKLNSSAWIYRENTVNDKKFIPNRGKMGGYYEGVPFFCYWLSIAHEKGLKHKQNSGPRGGYEQWFDTKYLTKPDARESVENALESALTS
tara:strand:- start:71 stop:1168 length:1098 start_codon:yes stop_codon:yes gene_type:complete